MSDGTFVLQKYNVIEKLASGGMAEIFLATRKEAHFQNKFYVIKRVLPSLADKPEYLVFLKDEAKALSLLQHHNVIGFHDFFFENEQFYLVMEYVAGKTMRDVFSDLEKNNQNLSIEYLLYIVTEVAAGLDYVHRSYDYVLDKPLNLVHRDLNPQNIMISFQGQIKIIDFGISKFDIRDDFTKTGMLKGKFGYMSPEQVDGIEIDARTDVFALGIVCWELLTNKRLFDGEDDFEKYNKIKSHQVASICELNSVVSKELDLIVMKALAPKASDRYQTAGDMAHDIGIYISKRFPDFRAEHFKKTISQLYAVEFKKAVEKLRQQFHTAAVEEAENTKTSRDFYLKQVDPEVAFSAGRRQRDGGDTPISMPDSFDLNINKSRLKLEVPNHEPGKKPQSILEAAAINPLEKKKKVKRPKPTLLEPERYKVQVTGIKSSSLHTVMNGYGSKFKDLIFFASLGGVGWLLFLTYEQGYLHVLLNSLYRMIK